MVKEINGCFRETGSLVRELRDEMKMQCGALDNVRLQGKYRDKDTNVWGGFDNIGLDNNAINRMFEEGTEDHCLFMIYSCLSDDLSNAGKQNTSAVEIVLEEYIAGHNAESVKDEG